MYSLAISLSAFLLFLVQPLISKMLLPTFGGGASIWITSLVFFQAMLLAGYGMTHLLVRQLGLRRHLVLTAILIVLSLVWLPVGPRTGLAVGTPTLELFFILLMSIGLPYFTLATTSPTLQYWIANDNKTRDQNPYVQYGVSNAGSLAGLLAYPFVLERYLTNVSQSITWTMLYLAFTVVMGFTIFLFVKHNGLQGHRPSEEPLNLARNLRLRWIFQAMVPSALLVVVTHHLSLDIVNFPLLWVAPLCLYLLTFIICFLFPSVSKPRDIRTCVGVISVLFLLLANYPVIDAAWELKIAADLICMFCIGIIFHGDLERAKPHKQNLTDFYLQLAAGGMLGGIAGAIIAPLLFDSTFEFYLVPVIAIYYMVVTQFSMRGPIKWLFRTSVVTSLAVSWFVHETGFVTGTIYQERTFYSTYAVRESEINGYKLRRLVAGTHVHGQQFLDEPLEHEPLAYYHRSTGAAWLFEFLNPSRVAVVGLGIGSVVEYGDRQDRFDLFELDGAVVEMATTWFTVLPEAKPQLRFYVGDGRVSMRDMPPDTYDLVVMDSFTSGSIPAHLITVEAIEELLNRTKERGAIAYHISNRHVNLLPVLNGIAGELNLGIYVHRTSGSQITGSYPATWVALTRNPELLKTLNASNEWNIPPDRKIVWTDQFSNVWSVLR
ncbi:MAG: fused MFS/spermidine synthase [Pseudomonadales bacterium]|nr:fused MFS/spermidine synthase [Pseudomonadales bacterium]